MLLDHTFQSVWDIELVLLLPFYISSPSVFVPFDICSCSCLVKAFDFYWATKVVFALALISFLYDWCVWLDELESVIHLSLSFFLLCEVQQDAWRSTCSTGTQKIEIWYIRIQNTVVLIHLWLLSNPLMSDVFITTWRERCDVDWTTVGIMWLLDYQRVRHLHPLNYLELWSIDTHSSTRHELLSVVEVQHLTLSGTCPWCPYAQVKFRSFWSLAITSPNFMQSLSYSSIKAASGLYSHSTK